GSGAHDAASRRDVRRARGGAVRPLHPARRDGAGRPDRAALPAGRRGRDVHERRRPARALARPPPGAPLPSALPSGARRGRAALEQAGLPEGRRDTVEALRASEARFRSLVQHGADLVVVLDAAGAVQYASPAAEDLLGYPPQELIGRSIFVRLHPDDTPAART